jgi:asparagine synthase (glutamine-hydrolysing)
VKIVPPGSVLTVRHGSVESERRYARFVPAPEGGGDAPRDAQGLPSASELREALRTSVHRVGRCAGHVRPSVMLSGGLDSTIVAALARDVCPDLTAFTVRFEGQEDFDYRRACAPTSDDTPFARLAARELGIAHVIVDVPRTSLTDSMRAVAAADGHGPAWEQQIAQHHLFAAAARAGHRVAFVGDAADETHFGYDFLLDPGATSSPRALLARLDAPYRLGLLAPDLVADVKPVEAWEEDLEAVAGSAGIDWRDGRRASAIRGTTQVIVDRWLPRLLHNGDAHSMAHGVEARVPFADPLVLELARRVPAELAVGDDFEKSWLRRAAPPEVPAVLRARRKSMFPRDQRAGSALRTEARRVLDDPHPIVAELYGMARVADLARGRASLETRERAALFQFVALHLHACSYGSV